MRWTPAAQQEVKVYLGILLIMGFVELPCYGDYWLTNLILRHHIIPEVMTRDRFDQLTTRPFRAFGGRSSIPRGQVVEAPTSRGRPQRLVPDDFRPREGDRH